jgi:hypothetical protein
MKSPLFLLKKHTKYMFLIYRETLCEGINFGFIYNEWFDANFSNLEAFVFFLSLILKKRFIKSLTET